MLTNCCKKNIRLKSTLWTWSISIVQFEAKSRKQYKFPLLPVFYWPLSHSYRQCVHQSLWSQCRMVYVSQSGVVATIRVCDIVCHYLRGTISLARCPPPMPRGTESEPAVLRWRLFYWISGKLSSTEEPAVTSMNVCLSSSWNVSRTSGKLPLLFDAISSYAYRHLGL